METTKTIDFVENATTKEAGIYAARYAWAFGRGVCKDTNSFAHRWPWVCMGMVALAATAASFVAVASAREERDAACKRMAQLQQQVEQLSCALEARKEASSPTVIRFAMPSQPYRKNSTTTPPKRSASRRSRPSFPNTTRHIPTATSLPTTTFSQVPADSGASSSARVAAYRSTLPPQSGSSSSSPVAATAATPYPGFPKPTA